MNKFILVSCSDENMMIDNEQFDTLAEAQDQMCKEWKEQGGESNWDDYVTETSALINNGAYVYLWKIIEVKL